MVVNGRRDVCSNPALDCRKALRLRGRCATRHCALVLCKPRLGPLEPEVPTRHGYGNQRLLEGPSSQYLKLLVPNTTSLIPNIIHLYTLPQINMEAHIEGPI